jgi:hypothetical protein
VALAPKPRGQTVISLAFTVLTFGAGAIAGYVLALRGRSRLLFGLYAVLALFAVLLLQAGDVLALTLVVVPYLAGSVLFGLAGALVGLHKEQSQQARRRDE